MEYTNENFQIMRNQMVEHFAHNMANKKLFRVNMNNDELYQIYLDSFPEEIKGIYRETAWHDCSSCKKFIRAMGNVVSINSDGSLTTLFSYETIPEYNDVLKAMHNYIVENGQIENIFLTSKEEQGIEHHFEQMEDGSVCRHDHFHLHIPDKFIKSGVKVGQEIAKARTDREVFEASLNSISIKSLEDVIDIINDGNLYRGEQWLKQLQNFHRAKKELETKSESEKNNLLWLRSSQLGTVISRMKNHSIGVLLMDLTDGMNLEYAVKKYEDIVAPSNYQRPKPLFTQAMLDNAQATITELGFLDSIQRRYAKMDDLSINDVLFANRNLASDLQDSTDIFAELSKDAIRKPKTFDYEEEIHLQDFITDVLPNAREINLYVDKTIFPNFVSLIAPNNLEAPSMFQWDNCFSWAYRNNVADALMKEQVKAMGGDVDVDLRASIRWNNTPGEFDGCDLDLHCTEPHNEEIYYSHMRSRRTNGYLDVDIINPKHNEPAVENIRYKTRSQMIDGAYRFRVHQFTRRNRTLGFEAEIEFDGTIYAFDYPHDIPQDDYIDIAEVVLENGEFTINELLSPEVQNIDFWNVSANSFVPVSLVCYSPNYWGDNAVGNKHIFFMLEGCKNEDRPNAWFNEYLSSELKEHRKVMEALGSKARVEETDDQLSGVGFATTQKNKVTLQVTDAESTKIYNVII